MTLRWRSHGITSTCPTISLVLFSLEIWDWILFCNTFINHYVFMSCKICKSNVRPLLCGNFQSSKFLIESTGHIIWSLEKTKLTGKAYVSAGQTALVESRRIWWENSRIGSRFGASNLHVSCMMNVFLDHRNLALDTTIKGLSFYFLMDFCI
jgi:hypothetical protein